MIEEIVVDISGKGLEATLAGLSELAKSLQSVDTLANSAKNSWTQASGVLGSLKISGAASKNYDKLSASSKSLYSTMDALLKPLGRNIGGLMRLRDTAGGVAKPLREIASAHRALVHAVEKPMKGSNTGALFASYDALDTRVKTFIVTLGNLASAYGNVAAAQSTLIQHNKNSFKNSANTAAGAAAGAGRTSPAAGGAGAAAGAAAVAGGGTVGGAAKRFAGSVGGYIARFGTASGLILAGHEVSKYEDNMASLGATINATEAQMKSFRDLAVKSAKESRVGIVELSEAMVELAKAGLDKPSQLKFLAPVVTKASVAGQMSAGDTTAMGVELMSQFNMKPSELPDMFGQATKAANLSVIGFKDLRTSMKYAGEAASSLGTEFTPVLAAIATLGQVGKKGSTGGTTLRQMMSQLAIGNEKTTKFLDAVAEKTGTNRDRLDITKNSLIDVLEALKQAEPTATDLFKSFDKQGGSGFIALVNNVDMMRKFLSEIDASGFEEVERVAARLEDTLGGQAGRLKNTIVATAAQLNTAMGDPFKVAFSALADLIGLMGELVVGTKEFADQWPVIGTGIKIVASAIAYISFKPLITAMATFIGQTKIAQGVVASYKGAFLGANIGATTLARNKLWATIKANKVMLLALAAWYATDNIKDDEGTSLLDKGLEVGAAASRAVFHTRDKGVDSYDTKKDQYDAFQASLKDGTLDQRGMKKMQSLHKELRDMEKENPEALTGGGFFARYAAQKLDRSQKLKQKQKDARAAALGGDLDEGFVPQDRPELDILEQEAEKVAKHDVNELIVAYEKAQRRHAQNNEDLYNLRDKILVNREILSQNAEELLKSYLNISPDLALPKLGKDAVARIAINPSDAVDHYKKELAEAEKIIVKLPENFFAKFDHLSKIDLSKVLVGDLSQIKLEEPRKAAQQYLNKQTKLKNSLIRRNKNFVLLAKTMQETERSMEMEEHLDQIKSGENAAKSTLAEISKEAITAKNKSKFKLDKALDEDTLAGEIQAIKETYADRLKAIEDLADTYNKEGAEEGEDRAKKYLEQANKDMLTTAQSRAETKATARFTAKYEPFKEQAKARFGGSSILEMRAAVKNMEALNRDIYNSSGRDMVNGNITPEQMTLQINAATEALKEFQKHATGDMFKNWAEDVAFAMTDTVGNGIQSMFDAMIDGTKDMGDVLKSVLRSIISQAFAQMFVRPVTDMMKTMLSQGINAIGTVGSAAAGSSYGINNAPKMSEVSSAIPANARDGATAPVGFGNRSLALAPRSEDPWVTQAYRNGGRNNTQQGSASVAGPVTGPNGEVRNAGMSVTNVNMTVHANDPSSFRSSNKQIRASLMRRA